MPSLQINIKLPPGNLIPAGQLCRMIAEALHPSLKNVKGVKCIIGKTVEIPNQSFTNTEDLSKADIKYLTKILDSLPPLHAGMNLTDKSNFIQKFKEISKRPSWYPVIASTRNIDSIEAQQNDTYTKLLNEIEKNINAGKITSLDEDLIEIPFSAFHTRLTRKDAIDYLAKKGLTKQFKNNGASDKRWTEELISELRIFRSNHTAKETAEKYGVATARIRQVIIKNNKEKQSNKFPGPWKTNK